MLLMGDEVRRTQRGNNNAYCQDNEISWFDWGLLERHADVHRFVRLLNAYRQRRDAGERIRDRRACTQLLERARIRWSGVDLDRPDWSDHSHSLAFTLESQRGRVPAARDLQRVLGAARLRAAAGADERITSGGAASTRRCASPDDICHVGDAPEVSGARYVAQPRSVVVLAMGFDDPGAAADAEPRMVRRAGRRRRGRSLDFTIARLGDCRVASPMSGVRFVSRRRTRPVSVVAATICGASRRPAATARRWSTPGPRERLFFDPAQVACGIVTCGGLCPGLNDVIRAIVLSLHHHYGVATIYGFRFGYEGLVEASGHEPLRLTPDSVSRIHNTGGSILASSRGPQEPAAMVDYLRKLGVSLLFAIGGDGTLRGAHAISEEAARRGETIAVVGVPKTIDNDVSFVQKTFGFETAVDRGPAGDLRRQRRGGGRAQRHRPRQADGTRLGVHRRVFRARRRPGELLPDPRGPVHAREAARRAAPAARAPRPRASSSSRRARARISWPTRGERDASGNVKYGDIGMFLRDAIIRSFKESGTPISLKYIDPSYAIRSAPAIAHDSGVQPAARTERRARGDERAHRHGRRLLEPPVHPRPDRARRLGAQADRSRRNAMEQRARLDRPAPQPVLSGARRTMNRTKIVATIGPASRTPAGPAAADRGGRRRLPAQLLARHARGALRRPRATSGEISRRDAAGTSRVLQDLCGPKMRLGPIPGDVGRVPAWRRVHPRRRAHVGRPARADLLLSRAAERPQARRDGPVRRRHGGHDGGRRRAGPGAPDGDAARAGCGRGRG